MKLFKSTIPIQYITLAYAVLYVLFIFSSIWGESYTTLSAEDMIVYSLFVLFIIGFSLSWYNKIITGILFLLWNGGMWIVELFFVEKDGGFGIISGVPFDCPRCIFHLGGY